MRLPSVSLEKPRKTSKLFLITLVRPTNTPNLVKIGLQGAPPDSGEHHGFVTFVLPSFPFPHLAYIVDRFARLVAQTTCSVSETCLLGVWSLQTHF